MTSREDIALQLTLANISHISHMSKNVNGYNDINTLTSDVKNFYNFLYNNVHTSDNNIITPEEID